LGNRALVGSWSHPDRWARVANPDSGATGSITPQPQMPAQLRPSTLPAFLCYLRPRLASCAGRHYGSVNRRESAARRRCHRKAGSVEGRSWGRHRGCGVVDPVAPLSGLATRARRCGGRTRATRAPGSANPDLARKIRKPAAAALEDAMNPRPRSGGDLESAAACWSQPLHIREGVDVRAGAEGEPVRAGRISRRGAALAPSRHRLVAIQSATAPPDRRLIPRAPSCFIVRAKSRPRSWPSRR
jgi:hypothetical protein